MTIFNLILFIYLQKKVSPSAAETLPTLRGRVEELYHFRWAVTWP